MQQGKTETTNKRTEMKPSTDTVKGNIKEIAKRVGNKV